MTLVSQVALRPSGSLNGQPLIGRRLVAKSALDRSWSCATRVLAGVLDRRLKRSCFVLRAGARRHPVAATTGILVSIQRVVADAENEVLHAHSLLVRVACISQDGPHVPLG